MYNLKEYITTSIFQAPLIEKPFKFFEIDNLIPTELYENFISSLPTLKYYKPLMHKQTLLNNSPTRYELSLLEEKNAIIKKFNNHHLISDLLDVFAGEDFKSRLLNKFKLSLDFVPYPHLYRDLAGFELPPHTDIKEKAITMGWYLPPDERYIDSGLDIFTREDDKFIKIKKIEYKPNKAFVFLRSDHSWHGAAHQPSSTYERNSLFVTFYHKTAYQNGKLIVDDPNVARKEILLYYVSCR